MNYMGEDDEMLYKQQDREDKRREFLERRARMGGPEAPEPCERCGGKGEIPQRVTRDMAIDAGDLEMEGQEIASASCSPCRGTGQRLVAGEESGQLCVECSGSGILEVREGSYPNGMYYMSSTCSRCLGTGVQP